MESSKKIPKGQVGDFISDATATALALKQATLVSGVNIKTLNGQSILGSGALTLSVLPQPFLLVVIPDSTFPSSTGNFKLRGSFFTPTMTVVITGQTINYITFISDNEVDVNVTTGAAEGTFAVTLDNGISATFNNALLIVLGDAYNSLPSEIINVVGSMDKSQEGKILTTIYGETSSADWVRQFDKTKNLRIEFSFKYSPLGQNTSFNIVSDVLTFTDLVGDFYKLQILITRTTDNPPRRYLKVYKNTTQIYELNFFYEYVVSMRWDGALWSVYVDNVFKYNFLSDVLQNAISVKVSVNRLDVIGLKYIELV
jgi:hypothetical protein